MGIYIYYAIINIALFILMGFDKLCAKLNRRRIKEATLLGLSLIGGGVGGFVGMLIFHHKTRKHYFSLVFILSIITHTIIIYISQ